MGERTRSEGRGDDGRGGRDDGRDNGGVGTWGESAGEHMTWEKTRGRGEGERTRRDNAGGEKMGENGDNTTGERTRG